jgi:hypothetical protein
MKKPTPVLESLIEPYFVNSSPSFARVVIPEYFAIAEIFRIELC